MKFFKRMAPYLLTVCCILSLTGCGETADAPEDVEQTPEVQLSALLTTDEVYTATGFAVGEPVDYADGGVNYYSADGSCSVYIGYQEMTAEEFEDLVAGFTNNGITPVEAPALGEKALWCEETLELLVYEDGYALDVLVEYGTSRPNDSLLAARQLAALLLEEL